MNLKRSWNRWRERSREAGRRSEATPAAHRDAALAWLCSAQDANNDGGVSHSYLIGERWMRSYPETTGYIIPTFLNAADLTGREDLVDRAVRMGDFELAVQRADGAIPELTRDAPTVFDTGQVIFGWVSLFRRTGEKKYLDAAIRGGVWLAEAAGEDGVWRHSSDAGGAGRVYNARVAWSLAELADAAKDERFRLASRRFLAWAQTQESSPGWYDRNCLTTDTEPLLHTIAYTARGQLESGLLLDDTSLVDASRRTLTHLSSKVGEDGFLPGRYDAKFEGTVSWACLTGMAQTSILWQRFVAEGLAGDDGPAFSAAADRVNGFLMRTQDLEATEPGLRGGIRGSYPVNGPYGQWRVLNWATKFFVDALMIAERPDALKARG